VVEICVLTVEDSEPNMGDDEDMLLEVAERKDAMEGQHNHMDALG